jgi:hypothetical protein
MLSGGVKCKTSSTIRLRIAGLRNTALAFSVKILPCETRRKMKIRVSEGGQARRSSLRAAYPGR